MFNGNKKEKNENVNLKSMNGIKEKEEMQNYHYINFNKYDYSNSNSHKKESIFEYENHFNLNNEDNSYLYNNKKFSTNSNEKLNSNKISSRYRDIKHNIPNYLINLDLNKISINNNKNIDISLLSSNSFINNNRQNNNSNKKEISPEKYLDDILRKNEADIKNCYNKIFIQTLSSDNNDNQNNSLLSNSIRSSAEFDFFKNTLNKNKKNNNLNKNGKLKKINNKENNIYIKENEISLEKEYKENSIKIKNHDDIPIFAKKISFMELVEKELANENMNYTKYNNKSFDILQNTES